MAKVLKKSLDLNSEIRWGSADYMEQYDKLWNEHVLSKDHITFPVADGQAVYTVVSYDPPVLQHVAIGDAWHYDHAILSLMTPEYLRKKVQEEKDALEFWNSLRENKNAK